MSSRVLVVLVEHRVEQLAQPVAAACCSRSWRPVWPPRRRRRARPILLSRRDRGDAAPFDPVAGRRTGSRRSAGPCGTTSPGGGRTAGWRCTVRSRASSRVSSPRRCADHLAVADRARRGAALGQALVEEARAPRRRSRRRTSRRPAARSARRGSAGRCRRRSGRCAGRRTRGAGGEALNGRPVSSTTSSARTIAAAVVGQDPRGGLGVALGQHVVQRRRPDARRARLSSRARTAVVGARELEPVEDRAGVERRAADQHRRRAAAAQLGDRRRAPSPGTPRPSRARGPSACRAGGAGCRAARRPAASPYRCPCRGRPASRRC